MDFRLILGGIANPSTVVWIVALVLSIVLMKKGGGRPERFLIIGSILMLASTLVNSSSAAVVDYVIRNGSSPGVATRNIIWSAGLISLPGIVCLFYAVWKKFNERTGMVTDQPKKDGN